MKTMPNIGTAQNPWYEKYRKIVPVSLTNCSLKSFVNFMGNVLLNVYRL